MHVTWIRSHDILVEGGGLRGKVKSAHDAKNVKQ